MGASFQSTGPVPLYYSDLSGNLAFLGHGERGARVTFDVAFEDCLNDVGGTILPSEKFFEGEVARVSITLTRWDWVVLRSILNRPFGNNVLGTVRASDMGTAMFTERGARDLVIGFTKAAVFAGPGMPTGFHFPVAFDNGPDEIMTGTGAHKVGMQFYCFRRFVPPAGDMTLYYADLLHLPGALPPIT